MPTSQDTFACQLIEDWQAPIYNYALRWLRQPSDAEDATQEIFIAILRDRRDLRSSDALRAWIYKLASRVLIKHKQRAARRERLDLGDDTLSGPAAEPGEVAETEERTRALRLSVAALPARIRAAVMLKYFQGLTQQEVAEALELPRSTVQSRLKKGLELLRESLSLSGAALATPRLEALLASGPAAPVPSSLSSSLLTLSVEAPTRAALITGGLMTTKLKAGIALAALALFGISLYGPLTDTDQPGQRRPDDPTRSASAGAPDPTALALTASGPRGAESGSERLLEDQARLANRRILRPATAGGQASSSGGDAAAAQEPDNDAPAKASPVKEAGANKPFPGFVSDKSLWITVLDQETRKPVDGALVILRPANMPGHSPFYQRAENGRLLLESVREGPHEFDVHADGYIAFDCALLTEPGTRTTRIELDAEAIERGLTVTLIRGTALTGQVRDADLNPIEAMVSVLSDDELPMRVAQIRTKGGAFKFPGLGAGRFRIYAKAAGHPPAFALVDIRNGGVPRALTMTLGKRLDVRVVVTDDQGQPIRGARIEAVPATEQGPSLKSSTGFDWHEGRRAIAQADESGGYALPGLAPGKVDMIVMAAGYQGAIRLGVEVPGADSEALAFRLSPGGSLAGRALDSRGKPAKGCWVSLRRGFLDFDAPETDATGRFRFDGLPPGPYELVAHSRAGEKATIGAVEAREAELTVNLASGLRVFGRVETPPGAPEISVIACYNALERKASVAPGGAFTMTHREPEPKSLTFVAEGYLPTTIKSPKVTPGKPLEVVVKLRLAAAASGTVYDSEGRPAGSVRIRAIYTKDDRWSEIGTDSFGRFRFEELEAGPLTIEVRWSDKGKEKVSRLPLEVFAGMEIKDLVLRLE